MITPKPKYLDKHQWLMISIAFGIIIFSFAYSYIKEPNDWLLLFALFATIPSVVILAFCFFEYPNYKVQKNGQ